MREQFIRLRLPSTNAYTPKRIQISLEFPAIFTPKKPPKLSTKEFKHLYQRIQTPSPIDR